MRHVSCTTKRLSEETPATTHSVVSESAERLGSPMIRVATKSMLGKERTICMGASTAMRHEPKWRRM